MKAPSPVLVYFYDNGEASLYNLTSEQYEKINDTEMDDPSVVLDKFEIPVKSGDVGYAPAWLVELGNMYGFEVESI